MIALGLSGGNLSIPSSIGFIALFGIALTDGLVSIGLIVGNSIDFPYSPVRLIVLMLPNGVSTESIQDVRVAAGLAYMISLVALAVFVLFLIGDRSTANESAIWCKAAIETFSNCAVCPLARP